MIKITSLWIALFLLIQSSLLSASINTPKTIDIINYQETASQQIIATSNQTAIGAWMQMDNGVSQVYTSNWNGEKWGMPIKVSVQNKNSANPVLISDKSNSAVIAWVQYDGSYKRIYIAHWDGSVWKNTTPISDATVNSISPRMASNNNLSVIIWNQENGSPEKLKIWEVHAASFDNVLGTWKNEGVINTANINSYNHQLIKNNSNITAIWNQEGSVFQYKKIWETLNNVSVTAPTVQLKATASSVAIPIQTGQPVYPTTVAIYKTGNGIVVSQNKEINCDK